MSFHVGQLGPNMSCQRAPLSVACALLSFNELQLRLDEPHMNIIWDSFQVHMSSG
jgi:hypothetical protein